MRWSLSLAAAAAMLFVASRAQQDQGVVMAAPHPADGARIRYQQAERPTLSMPDGKRRPIQSLLAVRRAMKFGDFAWNDNQVPPGEPWVRIDLEKQTMSVFRGGHEIGSAVILYGTDGKPTPTGQFTILQKAEQHRSSLYDAEMPYMLRLTGDGVAIHASDVREGAATHGCIGVPEAFAARLFAEMKRGDLVAIL